MSSEFILDEKIREFLRLLAVQGGPPLYEVPLHVARAMALIGQARFPVTRTEAVVEGRQIDIGKEDHLTVRIVHPPGRHGRLPGIYVFSRWGVDRE